MRQAKSSTIEPPTSDPIEEKLAATSLEDQPINEYSGKPMAKPSRRVRETPGGKDNINSIFGDEDEESTWKPTRRVRETPGGGGAAQVSVQQL